MKKLVAPIFFVLIWGSFQTVSAQLCTLTAAGATYTIPAASHYDATPSSNFTGVGLGDYLFEDGWFFRVSGDTQESFFPTPSTTTCVGSTGTITWTDVGARGLFSATNTLNLVSLAASTGRLELTMAVTNLTAGTLNISLFHGADLDVNGTAGTDSAVLLSPNSHIRITDATAGFAEYRATSPLANGFVVRPFAAATDVFGILADTTIHNFDNSGLPANNFDFTGGFQWNLTIPPGGTGSATVVLSGNVPLTVTSAGASIKGRVLSSEGRAISNTMITMTGSDGVVRSTRSNTFGHYSFEGIPTGETYVMNASRKGFLFAPQVVTVNDSVIELNLTPIE